MKRGSLTLLLAATLLVACHEPAREPEPGPSPVTSPLASPASPGPAGSPSPASAAATSSAVINLHRWSTRIGQGGQPSGEAGFRELARRGYELVLSVDGMPPDAETARRFGLRTLHVPIGYEGVTHAAMLQILRAVREAPGPVYIHCHHGKHRGPAAAALARMAEDGVSNEQAERDLKASGCSPRYAGLYAAVRGFRCPSAAEVAAAPAPQERVKPAGLRAAMIAVSHRETELEECADAGWEVPPQHPDLAPEHGALLLVEALRETARLPEATALGEDFLRRCQESEAEAEVLRAALERRDRGGATSALKTLKQSCNACHAAYRDSR
ncbi:MAG: cytochrome c [Planctomycetota bacterium]